eukprot:TRINITY_DN12309_c0_g1_i1.p2 TRINITY_DN12309_c0_g1~~TRINITY_DN12309_c0_g1_i1.p2  ORF type:complete len:199 (-),score=57.79 TRINITY_DN12309_c0_g1_i1:61-657(-)
MIESFVQHDSFAVDFWMRKIGEEPSVKWKVFVTAICEENCISDKSNEIRFLSTAIFGTVNVTSAFTLYDFKNMLNFYGPFPKIFQNLKLIVPHSWFVGKISSAEADKQLSTKPAGSFLLRYASPESGFDLGNWTIAYKIANGQMIKHKITKNIAPIFGSYSPTYTLGTYPEKFSGLMEVIKFLSDSGLINNTEQTEQK